MHEYRQRNLDLKLFDVMPEQIDINNQDSNKLLKSDYDTTSKYGTFTWESQ